MEVSDIHSHLYGEEFLVVNRRRHYAQIRTAISRLSYPPRFERSGGTGWRAVYKRFWKSLAAAGWKEGRCELDEYERFLEKDGIRIVAPQKLVTVDLDLFGRYPWLYARWALDVVVEILPTRQFAERLRKDSAGDEDSPSFEEVALKLPRESRNTPAIPLLLIGVTG